MKKWMIVILVLFSWQISTAQRPGEPSIDSVSVNREENSVWLSYTPDTSETIKGYYIYRFIYQAEQDIDSVFHKIDSIADPNKTFYHDNSPSYGAAVAPDRHRERYRVAAFNEQEQSLMSEIHATMHLKPVAFDSCNASNSLTWTRYTAWDPEQTQYCIFSRKTGQNTFSRIGHTEGTDTTFLHKYLDAGKTYEYFIHACHKETGYTSSSNVREVYTAMPNQPNVLEAHFATVNEAGNIEVEFHFDPSASVSYYAVQHTTDTTTEWKTVKKLMEANDPSNYETPYTIEQVMSAYKKHYFRVVVVNSCGVEYKTSGIVQTSVLRAKTLQQNTNQVQLEWTRQSTWPNSLVTYKIYRQKQDGSFALEGETEELSYTYSTNGTVSSSDNCFYVVAVNRDNGYSSRTNVACATEEAITGMPNAFNPESDVTENKVFKPVINYVDSYTFLIYNRWGDILFKTSKPSEGWKGRIKGNKPAPEGVYVYRIRYTKNGKTYQKSGTVTLLR